MPPHGANDLIGRTILRVSRSIAIVIVVALASGCYRSHGAAPDPADAARDSSVVRPDSARALDAGLLPDEPPLDPGPEARPSDDPARDWRDPPAPDESGPCCAPVTDTIAIPIGDIAIGDVDIEWNGEGWGVGYAAIGQGVLFQELASSGARVGEMRQLTHDGAWGIALDWSGGRFAVVMSREGDGPQTSAIAIVDRRGTIAAGWTPLELARGASVAHVSHRDRWLIASTGGTIDAVDRDARLVGRTTIESARGSERPSLVGLKSRAVMFFHGPEGVSSAIVYPMLMHDPSVLLVGREPPDDVIAEGDLLATRLRDHAIAVLTGLATRLLIVDPFAGETTTVEMPPLPVGTVPSGDLIGIDELDLLALCVPTPSGESRSIDLHLFGRDGAHRGAPVVIESSDSLYMQRCALGWDGERLFVAWNVYHDEVVRVRGYSLAP